MIIKGNVYDITTYVPSHPGGERALLKFAGRDGTENVQFHSSKMLEILNSGYFIGKLYKEEAPSRCTIS
jgi:cytochrome b involved in lipid metabolism